MISFNEAVTLILDNTPVMPVTQVTFDKSLDCYLAEDVIAKDNIPFADMSAVDGYALRLGDSATNKFKVAGMIKAGDSGDIRINAGEAVRIFTGAVIPDDANAVIMQEDVAISDEHITLSKDIGKGDNIRYAGEEFKKGDTAIHKGVRITPPVISLMATLGYARVKVRKTPKIAIISTGNELIRPDEPIIKGKIRDSNSYGLAAALKQLNIAPDIFVIRDDPVESRQVLGKCLEQYDILLISGGVSVGEYDLIRPTLSELDVNEIFWQIKIKPGKPVYFGRKNDKLVFGIPGNPVASLVVFHTLIKPALIKSMGGEYKPVRITARLTHPLKKKGGRLELVRGYFQYHEGHMIVESIGRQESHIMSGLARANCLIYFDADKTFLNTGDMVSIELLNW